MQKSLTERFIAPGYEESDDGYEAHGYSSEGSESPLKGKKPFSLLSDVNDDELDPARGKSENELSPYEKALRENEKKKQQTLEDLKREAEERERALEPVSHPSHLEN